MLPMVFTTLSARSATFFSAQPILILLQGVHMTYKKVDEMMAISMKYIIFMYRSVFIRQESGRADCNIHWIYHLHAGMRKRTSLNPPSPPHVVVLCSYDKKVKEMIAIRYSFSWNVSEDSKMRRGQKPWYTQYILHYFTHKLAITTVRAAA